MARVGDVAVEDRLHPESLSPQAPDDIFLSEDEEAHLRDRVQTGRTECISLNCKFLSPRGGEDKCHLEAATGLLNALAIISSNGRRML